MFKPLSIKVILVMGIVFCLVLATGRNIDAGLPALKPPPRAVNTRAEDGCLQLRGYVEPARVFILYLLPGETCSELLTQEGQLVEKEAVLVRMKNRQLRASLAGLMQKRLELEKSKTEIALLKEEIKIKKGLLDSINYRISSDKKLAKKIGGYVPVVAAGLREKREELKAGLAVLTLKDQAMVKHTDQIEGVLALIEEDIGDLREKIMRQEVKAPFAGALVKQAQDLSRLKPGDMILELWDTSSYRIRGKIMQHQLPLVQLGDKVEISVEFIDGKKTPGVIDKIGCRALQGAQQALPTFEVEIKVDTAPKWLKPGMNVSMKLINSRKDKDD